MARKTEEQAAQPDGQPDGQKADGKRSGPFNRRVGVRADMAHRLRTVAAGRGITPCELADEALVAHLKSWRLPSQVGRTAAGGAADAETSAA